MIEVVKILKTLEEIFLFGNRVARF